MAVDVAIAVVAPVVVIVVGSADQTLSKKKLLL